MAQTLGDFEKAILTAILNQKNYAYGTQIYEWLRQEKIYSPSLPAIYTVLTRLEQKGFLKAEVGEATSARGGRAKTYFAVTGTGQRALHSSFSFVETLMATLQKA